LCNIAAPDIFKPREEDGHAFVDESGINSGSEQAIWDAQATCPEQAIEVTED
jgi:ferredoxin